MKLQEKQKELEQEIIANLRAIPKMPEGLLPHTVYVEEEGEDDEHHGIPVYTAYKLEEIRSDGSCMLYNPDTPGAFPLPSSLRNQYRLAGYRLGTVSGTMRRAETLETERRRFPERKHG